MVARIFKKIFPTEKNIAGLIDAAKEGVDYSFFSAEERSKFALKIGEFSLKLYEALAPYNTAMRHIAFAVAIIWGLQLLFMNVLGLFDHNFYDESKSMMGEFISPNFGLVMKFYFGGAVANGIIRTALGGKK